MKIDAFDFSTVDMLGERLCLDFANSVGTHSDPSDPYVKTYSDLVSWSHFVGIVDDAEAQRLLNSAAQQPSAADDVLHKAIIVREAMYEIFADSAADQTPQTRDLDILNEAIAEAREHMRLVPTERGFDWTWVDMAGRLDQMLWPVAWSAAELLLSGDFNHLRACASDDCGWLFLDTSRNHSRRWCDMKTCGNRAKARRHYKRARSTE
jgi:predicted RNA-binding Zn ribbon-like protein